MTEYIIIHNEFVGAFAAKVVHEDEEEYVVSLNGSEYTISKKYTYEQNGAIWIEGHDVG